MTDLSPSPTSQERVASALAYLLFLIPFFMNIKTEFTMFHAKQSLILTILLIIINIIWMAIPFIGWFIKFVSLVIWLVFWIWSLYQSYLGNRFIIPGVWENTNMILAKLGIEKYFSVR